MDVNSLRFTPDWAGQTCVCSCCLRSCWGTGWGVRLSKLPTCEVSKTKTLGCVQSHLYGKKEEEKNKPEVTFLQYSHIKQLPKLRNDKNEILYDMTSPQLLLPGQGWWGSVGGSLISRQSFSSGSYSAQTASNRLPEPLEWTVNKLFTIHRATIDEPWRLRGFGGGPTYRCALWVALLLNQEASEKKKQQHFDTEWAHKFRSKGTCPQDLRRSFA